jgi:hypothetical protein
MFENIFNIGRYKIHFTKRFSFIIQTVPDFSKHSFADAVSTNSSIINMAISMCGNGHIFKNIGAAECGNGHIFKNMGAAGCGNGHIFKNIGAAGCGNGHIFKNMPSTAPVYNDFF